MNKFVVKLHGQIVSTLNLEGGNSYLFGRSEECNVVLQNEKGISRQHFKVFQQDGVWIAENLSKYGEILVQGKNQQLVRFSETPIFTVPPYEFQFVVEESHLPAAAGVESRGLTQVSTESAPSDQGAFDSSEKTFLGVVSATPYFKVFKNNEQISEVKLEGSIWIAGRESTCAIHLDDPRISRKQLEITFSNNQFYIRDLKSVNGTLLNGNLISAEVPTALNSGDKIAVLDYVLIFEQRDADYSNKVLATANVAFPPADPNYSQQGGGLVPYDSANYIPQTYDPSQYQVVHPKHRRKKKKKKKEKINPIRIAIIAVVAIAAIMALLPDSDDKAKKDKEANIDTSDPFSRLTPEQQNMVKHSYNLAKNLYMQQKFELAASEIAKIHQLIPQYEDSKEIEAFALEAIKTIQDRKKIEENERRQQELQAEVNATVDKCQKLVDDRVNQQAFESCISPALERDPENPRIKALRAKIEQIITDRNRKAADQEAYQASLRRARALFEKAERIAKSGNYLDAIAAFKDFLNAGLPDPGGLHNQAQANISRLQKEMKSKLAFYVEESRKAKEAGDYKTALVNLRKAKDIDPSDTTFDELKWAYLKDLSKQMRVIYQESIVEESIGSVDSAKEKWQRILSSSLPDEEYYKKAKLKLKKYGG